MSTCWVFFVEFVLQEIDFHVRHSNKNFNVQVLNSLTYERSDVHELLFSTETVKSQIAARIIIFIGNAHRVRDCLSYAEANLRAGHNNPSMLICSAKDLFQNATTDDHLGLLIRILTDELVDKMAQPYVSKGGYFSIVLEQILSEYLQELSSCTKVMDSSNVWINLLTLLRLVSN